MQSFHRSSLAALVVAVFAVAHGTCARADGFTPTGSLDVGNGGRYGAAAALLPDFRVLIAGGNNGGSGTGDLATAVIWNPATGTFTASANNLSLARTFPTGTVLTNTKILIADGGDYDDQTGAYANCDLYDPSTGNFTATGSTQQPRHNGTATLLGDGSVLIAGGILNDLAHTRTATAELYNPNTGTFTSTGSMHAARDFHVAALLPNGNVLIAGGGDGSGTSLDSAEIYNTSGANAGTFTLLANHMVEGRDDATATLLQPSGKVLIVGGVNSDVASGTAELFDPVNNTFTAVPSTIPARHFHSATLLQNGKVLIAGGLSGPTDPATALTDAQIYDPTANAFTVTGSLGTARFYHTATLLHDGRVLVAGGYAKTGVTATAEIYGALADPIFANGFDTP